MQLRIKKRKELFTTIPLSKLRIENQAPIAQAQSTRENTGKNPGIVQPRIPLTFSLPQPRAALYFYKGISQRGRFFRNVFPFGRAALN